MLTKMSEGSVTPSLTGRCFTGRPAIYAPPGQSRAVGRFGLRKRSSDGSRTHNLYLLKIAPLPVGLRNQKYSFGSALLHQRGFTPTNSHFATGLPLLEETHVRRALLLKNVVLHIPIRT